MRTTYRIRQPYADRFLQIADEFQNDSPAVPERFKRLMKEHTGIAGRIFGDLDENGLEKKNPVIVAIGDSVTAGHFESTAGPEKLAILEQAITIMMSDGAQEDKINRIRMLGDIPQLDICDARESFVEKFRHMLIDKYEYTSVSVINSGIAGDMLPSMIARSYRDVIRYDPDLVLINGALNWDDRSFGDENAYKVMLQGFVRKLKTETSADIILLTPNGDLPNDLFSVPGQGVLEPTTYKRCEKIREVAKEEGVCLADVRKVWDKALEAGCPWDELLANNINHPSVEGHEVYAKVLMKLF